MSRLLINEYPLLVLPSLGAKIGLNEALVLQQLHYWIEKSDLIFDNKKWVYNTIEEWEEQFPFWSNRTIKRVFENLEKLGLIFKEKLAKNKFDKTNYYSINYDILSEIENEKSLKKELKTPVNDDTTDGANLTQSIDSQFDTTDGANLTQSYIVKSFDRDYSETTTETLSPLSSLTTKESSVQKTSEREDERGENKKFLSFVNQIRKEYAPTPEQNIFPRIMQVRDSDGNVSAFKIDNKGHLYLSSPSGTRDLTSAEADRYWHLIFQNKDRLFPNGDWHPNIKIDLSPCNPQGQSELSPHPTKEVNGAT